MSQEISLTSATRTNLLSLQNTTTLIGQTQQRLATGLKVNSALDDALAFFKARSLNDRASDLQNIKSNIDGSVSVITAATQGLTSMESVLQQMKALAQSAISAPESSTRAKLASQFNELRTQVDGIAYDSSFDGVNLLKNNPQHFQPGGDEMTVKFNENTVLKQQNQLVVSGLKVADYKSMLAQSAVTHGTPGNTLVWGQTGSAAVKAINASINAIDSALVTVRQASQQFGTNASMLQIRADFTTN